MSIDQGPSFRANESIGAYVVVAINGSSTAAEFRCELADTSTSIGIGVIQDNVSTDGSANVVSGGLSRAQCGASVSAGASLTWQTATGKVIEHNPATTTTIDRFIGVSLSPGSTDSVIMILVNPSYLNIV